MAEHVASMGGNFSRETLRRIIRKWEDNIKILLQEMGLDMVWIDLARDTVMTQALAKFRVP